MAEHKNNNHNNKHTGGKLLRVNEEKQRKYRAESKPHVVPPRQPRQRGEPVRMSLPQSNTKSRVVSKGSVVRGPSKIVRNKPLLPNVTARRRPDRRRPRKRRSRKRRGKRNVNKGFHDRSGGRWDPINNQEEHRTSWDAMPEKHEDNWIDKFMDVAPDLVSHVLPLVLGAGDYSEPDPDILATGDKPTSNSLLACATNGKVGSEVPYMHADGNETRIQHREYIGDVYSTTSAFEVESFVLNPGMNETNPWLAPIANQFTAYRYLGMTMEFVSEGSEYTNSAGLGYVSLGTQYNSYAPDFTDKRSMLNSQFADAAKPSKSFTHWIECKPGSVPLTDLYTRAGSVPTGADKRLYDLGKTTLAVGGNTADDAVIGELWATYDVELLLPKTSDASGESINYFNGTLSGGTGPTPFGNGVITQTTNSTFSITSTGTVLAFPNNLRGMYSLIITWAGTAATFNPAAMSPVNCAWSSYLADILSPPSGTLSITKATMIKTLVFTEDDASLSILGSGTYPVGTVNIVLQQIPQAPSTLNGIFDRGGKSRQASYDAYMKRYHNKGHVTPKLATFAQDESSDDDEEVIVLKETDSFGLELSLITGDYIVYDANDIPFPYSLPNSEVKVKEDVAKKLLMLRNDEEFDNTIKLIIIEHNEFRLGKQ